MHVERFAPMAAVGAKRPFAGISVLGSGTDLLRAVRSVESHLRAIVVSKKSVFGNLFRQAGEIGAVV